MEPNFLYKEKTDLMSLGKKKKKGGERALLIDYVILLLAVLMVLYGSVLCW